MGGSAGNRGWQIGRRNTGFDDSGRMHFGYSEDAVGTWGGLTSKSTVPVGQWTHFAVTFAGDQFVRMYINGVMDEEVINSAETLVRARINGVNNAMFQVGNRGDNHSLSTLGHIDDFGLWDVALTGEQIQRIYAKGNTEGLDLQVALGADTYTVNYDANGGEGSIADDIKIHGVDLTLSDGSGFSRTGYAFSGWNTSADGSGTNYDAGAMYIINAGQTFFAKWTVNTYNVIYDANGGTGSIANATKTHNVDLILSDGTGFTRAGYMFSGWNTQADGTGTAYAASYNYSVNEDLTLFALWTVDVTSVTQGNSGEISIYPNPAADRVYFNNLPENSRIVLVDLLGRNILEKNSSELSDGLSLQPYTKGYYMIRVMHGPELVKTIKVIKK